MSAVIDGKSHSTAKKSLTEQEKQDYYRAWECSGMSKAKFCKENGLSIHDFYYWRKLVKPKTSTEAEQFLPVTALVSPVPTSDAQNITHVEVRLPNQAQLLIKLQEHQLVPFIQELCNAVTIVR